MELLGNIEGVDVYAEAVVNQNEHITTFYYLKDGEKSLWVSNIQQSWWISYKGNMGLMLKMKFEIQSRRS